MSKDKSSKQSLEIRSREYEQDPNSHERWFEIWVSIAKKELLGYYQKSTDKKD